MALSFAKDKMLPLAAEWDQKEIFPAETLREAAALGFGGALVIGWFRFSFNRLTLLHKVSMSGLMSEALALAASRPLLYLKP